MYIVAVVYLLILQHEYKLTSLFVKLKTFFVFNLFLIPFIFYENPRKFRLQQKKIYKYKIKNFGHHQYGFSQS